MERIRVWFWRQFVFYLCYPVMILGFIFTLWRGSWKIGESRAKKFLEKLHRRGHR